MKMISAVVAGAFALAAAPQLVAAGFVNPGAGHSWPDYCTPQGTKVTDAHLCLIAKKDINGDLASNDGFTGYVHGSNHNGKSGLLSSIDQTG